MRLNIYNKKSVVKTYEARTYDLMFGTLEDVADAVKLDQLQTGTDAEIIKLIGNLVLNSMGTVRELMMDIFDGITDEELRHTKITEIAEVLRDVVVYTITQLNIGAKGN